MTLEEKQKAIQQDALRKKVIEEQLKTDPIIDYVAKLNDYIVEDELRYQEQTGKPEEWTNIPQLVARFLVINQKHLKAIVDYNQRRSSEETTEKLRDYTEAEI